MSISKEVLDKFPFELSSRDCFVDVVEDSGEFSILCGICKCPYAHEVTMLQCGHFFDSACIEEHLHTYNNHNCPICRADATIIIDRTFEAALVKILHQLRDRFAIYACPYCPELLKFPELVSHARTCSHRVIVCPARNEAGIQCEARFTLAAYEDHLQRCPVFKHCMDCDSTVKWLLQHTSKDDCIKHLKQQLEEARQGTRSPGCGYAPRRVTE